MPTVSSSIPPALQPDVDAAIEWFNRDQETPFEVTGILDPDAALESETPRELKLVLCGGDRCEQRSFCVERGDAGREIRFLEDSDAAYGEGEGEGDRQAELDPPPGPRRGWFDRTLARHDFTVVLFYRGFW